MGVKFTQYNTSYECHKVLLHGKEHEVIWVGDNWVLEKVFKRVLKLL